MKISAITGAAALALAAIVSTANAAQTWTVTVAGRIDYGTDVTGVFGTAGQNLADLQFTQVITVSIDTADWTTHSIASETGLSYSSMWGAGPAFSDTVTINGRSVTFFADLTSQGNQSIGNGYYDTLSTSQIGKMSDGGTLSASFLAFSNATNFITTSSFGDSFEVDLLKFSVTNQTGFSVSGNQIANFATFDAGTYVSVVSNGYSYTAPPPLPTVPEPETYAMLLAGLGLVGFAARRKRTAA